MKFYFSPRPVTFAILVETSVIFVFSRVLPVYLGSKKVEEEGGYLCPGGLVHAGFDEQHRYGAFFAEPGGDGCPGAAAPDDNKVIPETTLTFGLSIGAKRRYLNARQSLLLM